VECWASADGAQAARFAKSRIVERAICRFSAARKAAINGVSTQSAAFIKYFRFAPMVRCFDRLQ
jgi:hypothetical protein